MILYMWLKQAVVFRESTVGGGINHRLGSDESPRKMVSSWTESAVLITVCLALQKKLCPLDIFW